MSKIAIRGATTGTGTFTIESPATNTDRSLTLPDGGGTLDRLERTGNVLQVVSAVNNNYQEVTTTTYTDTATTAVITPSSTSSKILVIVHGTLTSIIASQGIWANLRIYRNSTSNLVYVADYFNNLSAGTDSSGENKYANSFSINHLDSPSSTSAQTYTLQIASGTTSNSGRVRLNNSTSGQNTNLSNITLMEIAG